MFEESNHDEFSIDKVVRFERMIEKNAFSFLDVEDYESIVDYYLEIEFYKRARKAIDIGLAQHPKNLALSMISAEMLSQDQRYNEALNVLNDVLPFNPNNVELLLGIGRLYSIVNDFNSADHFFNLALENSFEEREMVLNDLAFEYQNMGNCEKAIDVMKEILLLNSENETALLEIGVAFNEVDRDEEAIRFFHQIIDSNPYSYLSWFNLGTIHSKLKNHEEALFAFEMCLIVNEKFSAAYYGIANIYIIKKEYRKAIDYFNVTFKIEQPHAYAYCSIGECYEKIGDYNKALTFYEKSLELDVCQSNAWIGIGVVKDLKDQPLEAKKYIEKALLYDEFNPEFWYIYAELLQKIGCTSEADDAFKKVVELDPNNIEAWIDYSNFLYENNALQKAVKTIRTAINNNSDENDDLHFRLIAMLIADNKLTEAKNKLHLILQKDTKTASRLYEIYPQAKEIKEIVDIIALYKG